MALCDVAHAPPPTERDWERLGVAARPAIAGNPDFAHGAWQALAWMLWVRPDPPIELPERDEDGTIPPWERRYAVNRTWIRRCGDPWKTATASVTVPRRCCTGSTSAGIRTLPRRSGQ